MAQPLYVAVYERDRWSPAWSVWIDGLPGVHTFGTRLAQARANVRDALALWLDTQESALEIEDDIRLPDAASEALRELESARVQLAGARQRVAAANSEVTTTLLKAGISMRDAAELLGLSHQRVSQLFSRDGGI